MKEDEKEDEAELAKAIAGVVAFVGTIVLRTWVVAKLWAWFIVPAFGVAVPRLPIVYGLTCLVILVLPPQIGIQKLSWTKIIGLSIGLSLLSLLFGWIAHLAA